MKIIVQNSLHIDLFLVGDFTAAAEARFPAYYRKLYEQNPEKLVRWDCIDFKYDDAGLWQASPPMTEPEIFELRDNLQQTLVDGHEDDVRAIWALGRLKSDEINRRGLQLDVDDFFCWHGVAECLDVMGLRYDFEAQGIDL